MIWLQILIGQVTRGVSEERIAIKASQLSFENLEMPISLIKSRRRTPGNSYQNELRKQRQVGWVHDDRDKSSIKVTRATWQAKPAQVDTHTINWTTTVNKGDVVPLTRQNIGQSDEKAITYF